MRLENALQDPQQLPARMAAYLRTHQMLSGVRTLGLAVSGGSDSMALLHALFSLKSELEIELAVIHINHGLRGEDSDADEALVCKQARQMELPVYVHRIEAGVAPVSGLEEWARNQRLGFFRHLIAKEICERVATGHTQRDQAETVLFRFLRGTGPHGLGGIPPVSSHGIVRPLLWASRDDVLGYVAEFGIPWREDHSNQDPRFARNRLRNQLLPVLKTEWNPQLDRALAQTAEIASEESSYLERIVDETIAEIFSESRYGWETTVSAFRNLHPAIQRRTIRHLAAQIENVALGYDQAEQVRRLAASPRMTGQFTVGALVAERSGTRFRMVSRTVADSGCAGIEPHRFAGTAKFALEDGAGVFELEILRSGARSMNGINGLNSGYTEGWSLLRPSPPGASFLLRQWRPGDAYQPLGSQSTRKLKELFQRSQVPRWRRQTTLVLENEGQILWCRGFGPSAQHAATDDDEPVMAVRFTENR
jgi:tRNA(Ile)-lysidine synthase